MSSTITEQGYDDISNMPDQDLEDIVAAIKDGAESPADAFGFSEDALNAIEKMALSYYRAALYHKAAPVYAFVLQMDNRRSSPWRGLGACAHALKNHTLAIQCYEFAVERNADDTASKVFLGEALCQMGRKTEGLDILDKVVEKGPIDLAMAPYVTRARAIIGAGGGVPPKLVLRNAGERVAVDAAEAMREQGISLDPDEPLTAEAMMANPGLANKIKDLSKAVREGKLTYAEVGGFTDNELDGAYAVACKYAEMGQYLEATNITGYLIFIDSYKPRYHQLAGICLQNLKEYGMASVYYRFALSLEEDDPMTLIYYGENLILEGKIDEGLTEIKKGVEIAEQSSEHSELVGRANVLIKQFSKV
ncbi:hypothetical protein KAI87_10055 [Myxococcota bacterium]|nr:hypothetical protein [Myxococcota bacterium]